MLAICNANLVLENEILWNADLLIDNGKIVSFGKNIGIPANAQVLDAKGTYVGPDFVDIHVHGDGGAHMWETSPEKVASYHLQHGTTTMVATMVYSQSRESLLEATKNVQNLLDAGRLPNVFAVAFEGSFINPERGSNSKTFARSGPDSNEYLPLYETYHGKIAQWMYAPEMDIDGSFADFLQEKGIVTAVGHTNASPAQICHAVDKGATIATHLYDAMGCWLGDDSWQITGTTQETVAVGCLICPELISELIPDSRGVHVKPANLQLVYRMASPDRIAIITDCCACDYDPADYPPDHFRSTEDLTYNHMQQLAGSRLTMEQALRNFRKHTGASIPDLFRMSSTTPASAIGIDHITGSIAVGKYADLVFLDDALQLKRVIFRGETVKENTA